MRPHHGRRRRLGTAPDGLFTHYYPNCSVAIASRRPRRPTTREEVLACDVCDEDDVRRVCDSIDDLVGVIHCAGVTYGGPFTSTNENDSKLCRHQVLGHAASYNATKDRSEILLARVVHLRAVGDCVEINLRRGSR